MKGSNIMNKNCKENDVVKSERDTNSKPSSKGNSRRGKSNRRKTPPYKTKKEFKEMQDYAKDAAYSNDPAWYASDPTLARDSASIPFSWATGAPVDLNPTLEFAGTAPGPASGGGPVITMPGIMALSLSPTVGYSMNPTDPINIAATAVYSFVRHQNSGSANYDAPDLMIYILAMADFISMLNFASRVYGVVSLYSTRNRYVPDVLLKAMGMDPDDVREHIASFRYQLNLIANKAASLAVPSTMSYFKRKAFLYTGIYTEGTSAKDQLYLYVPSGYYQLAFDTDGAFRLDVQQFNGPNAGYTVEQLIAMLNGMLDPMLANEDINIMSGDIIKAYGEGGVLKYGRIDENYVVTPQMNIPVLEQMKNAIAVPAYLQSANLSVYQDATKGYLVSNPVYSFPENESPTVLKSKADVEMTAFAENRILVTTTEFVDPSLVLENTRLMLGASYDATENELRFYGCTEICTGISVLTLSRENPQGTVTNKFNSYTGVFDPDSGVSLPPAYWGGMFAAVRAFDFTPMLAWVVFSEDTGNGYGIKSIHRSFDYDNYAVLTWQDLQRMHEACLLNMLYVPSIGSVFA